MRVTEPILQWGSAIIGSNLVTFFLGLWITKREKVAKAPADLLDAMSEFSNSLSHGGKDLIEMFREEFKTLRGGITDARETAAVADARAIAADARSAAAEARSIVADARATESTAAHEECRDELRQMKLWIENEIKTGRVASWGEKPPLDL